MSLDATTGDPPRLSSLAPFFDALAAGEVPPEAFVG
jgi:hypothetical protein